MIDQLLRLAQLLRAEGIDVSASEVVDSLRALDHVQLASRAHTRNALRACMVKQADHGVFDRCFAEIFDGVERADAPAAADAGPAAHPAPAGGAVDQAVLQAMLDGDDQALQALAAQAVQMFAGIDADGGSQRYFMHRVMRGMDLSRMLSAAMQRLRSDDTLSEFELMLQRTELMSRIEEFRRTLAAEIARQLRGHEAAPDVPERSRPEDLDLLQLSRADAAAARRVLQPIVRRLAARAGRRRRRRANGRLDVRRTVRHSLQTGGVPIDPVTRKHRPHRAELVVLCDVSGSVAEFAQFTFTLVNALHDEVRSVRSFAFVDGVAEVSDVFRTATHEIAVSRLVERKGVVGLDGHSDYGRVFAQFAAEPLLSAIGPRTSLIVCGDARGNYRPDNAEAFSAIARRARKVYWLNPEPRAQWGGADSLIEIYRPWCTEVLEARTLGQLEAAAERLV
jgi:uncharacterized protein